MSSSSSEMVSLSAEEVHKIARNLYNRSQEPGADESAVLDEARRLISEHHEAQSYRPRMVPAWSGPSLDLSSKPRELPIPDHLFPQ